MTQAPVYLDHQASTPLDPRVKAAMERHESLYANPHTTSHLAGIEAGRAVDTARRNVARAIGGDARRVIFTSGATEANNLALFGVAKATVGRRKILVIASEHSSVVEPAFALKDEGFDMSSSCRSTTTVSWTWTPSSGQWTSARFWSRRCTSTTRPVLCNPSPRSPKSAIVTALCCTRTVRNPSDGCPCGLQPSTRICLPYPDTSATAPRASAPSTSTLTEKSQSNPCTTAEASRVACGPERSRFHYALGSAKPVASPPLTLTPMPNEWGRLGGELLEAILQTCPAARLNGSWMQRVPGAFNVCFPGAVGDELLSSFNGIYVSSGSACESDVVEPSRVLLAYGLSESEADASLRFCVGRFTEDADIEVAKRAVARGVRRLGLAKRTAA